MMAPIDTAFVGNCLEASHVALGELRTWVAERQHRSTARLLTQLQERLADREMRCSKDEFAAFFNKALAISVIDTREFKTHLLAAVLTDAYCLPPDEYPAAIMLALVDKLDVHHLQVLRCVVIEVGRDKGADGEQPAAVGFQRVVEELGSTAKLEQAMIADIATATIQDLISSGLVRTRPSKANAGKIAKSLNWVNALRSQVLWPSTLGLQFASYLLDEGGYAPSKL